MSVKVQKYKSLKKLVERFRDDLKTSDYVLLFAFNGTGKTRLSMEFKDTEKRKKDGQADTLYFNAYTEDLFYWENDLKTDRKRVLEFNGESEFFSGIQEQDMDNKIRPLLQRYADFNFLIEYKDCFVNFIREEVIKGKPENIENVKISRGEENIFIWCFFLAIAQLAIDKQEGYDWVKYIFIDDPISSLDENNTIAVASHLAQMLKNNKVKTIISSHHSLFYNIIYNELKNERCVHYFLHKNDDKTYTLQKTDDTPFFHHVASLSELKQIAESNKINTYHFNLLRSVLEKTSSFFGYNDMGQCIHGIEDKVLFERALNLLSHGNYSIFEPVPMLEDTKDLFKRILSGFLEKYKFELPELNAKKLTKIKSE